MTIKEPPSALLNWLLLVLLLILVAAVIYGTWFNGHTVYR
jgi:hypothetical protein